MFSQYFPLSFPFILGIAFFCHLAFAHIKLDKFRRNVRPGDVINYKTEGNVEFKQVVSRPSREIIWLKNMDDEFNLPFRTLINKIYPL